MSKSTKMNKTWVGAALAAAWLCATPASAQVSVVSVTGGRIEGVHADGVTSFKGIPFAAPPVGNMRWRAPQPVRRWADIKQADHFAPACVQPVQSNVAGRRPTFSEDCLYLNVWTPAKSARDQFPVMVWIYGGGWVGGMTSAPQYDGTRLAHKGVVLVSISYRLGALGFLADPQLDTESPHHVSGNYGVLDMIAALKWVKANIAKFGGDPSRVTTFGQSSGGTAVAMLAASPLAKGLFQRAISESGSISSSGVAGRPRLPAAEAIDRDFLARLGARDITAARTLPAQALLQAQARVGRFWPVVDGYVVPDDQYDLFEAGRFSGTPLLIGSNADEGASLVSFILPHATPARFEALIHMQVGPHADQILALYPHATDAQAGQAARDMLRDTMAWSAWAWASLSSKGRDNVYLYYFDRHSPQAPLGPTHGAEVVYVFGNLTSNPRLGLTGTPGPGDLALSQEIQDYWVNFARTGDPNGPGLSRWPAFSASSPRAMYLDVGPHDGPVPNLEPIQALETAYARGRQEHTAAARAAH
jgi:para-nitrobenzyl esterase